MLLKVATLRAAKKVMTRNQALLALAASFWNMLPAEICQAPSLFMLRKLVKMELFKAAFNKGLFWMLLILMLILFLPPFLYEC